MRAHSHRWPVATLFAVALLGACQYRPTIVYPPMPEAGATEAGFDCAALDDAILKADAVRWVMRQDGARLLSPGQRAARATTDVLSTVAASMACFFCFSPIALGDEGTRTLDRADRRVVSLLRLKKSRGCDPRPTALSGVSDLDLHGKVATLIADESQSGPGQSVGDLRAERMRLLDSLRR